MNLGDIRSGLKTRLDTISGLRAHRVTPDTINVPAAVIGGPIGTYLAEYGGSATVTIPVFILVQRVAADRGQDALDDYLDTSGSKSVITAIDGDKTLGGKCDSAAVLGWENYGATFVFNDVEYLGVQINVEVYT